MERLLLITPPFTQVNCPYPATAYLKGYLERKGFPVDQFDLSIELIGEIFSATFLREVFDGCDPTRFADDPNLVRIHALRGRYLATVGPVLTFLRGQDPTLAGLICGAEFLPQAGRFETLADLDAAFRLLPAQRPKPVSGPGRGDPVCARRRIWSGSFEFAGFWRV